MTCHSPLSGISTLSPEQSANVDATEVAVGVTVAALIIIAIIMAFLLYRKYKCRGCRQNPDTNVLSLKNTEAANKLLNNNDKNWEALKKKSGKPFRKNTPSELQGLTANEHQVNVYKGLKCIQHENM